MRHTQGLITQLRKQYPYWSAQRIEKAARAVHAKQSGIDFNFSESFSFSEKFNKFIESNSISLAQNGDIKGITYNCDIHNSEMEFTEKLNSDGTKSSEVIIGKGRAIYPTVSRNHTKYLKSELLKASETLKNVPFQKDHSYSVDANFGKIIEQKFNTETGNQLYFAELDAKDPITRKMELKHIESVSVALHAKRIECSFCGESMGWYHDHIPGFEYEKGEDGKKEIALAVPRDFFYVHLGAVTTPGIPDASISVDSESFISDNLNDLIIEGITETYEPFYNSVITESMDGKRKMSDEDKNEVKTKLDLREAQLLNKDLERQLQEQKDKAEKAEQDLTKFENQKLVAQRESLVEEVISAELELGELTETGVPKRQAVLMKEETDYLKGTVKIYENILAKRGKVPKRSLGASKSKSFDVSDSNTSEVSSKKTITDINEREQKERLIENWGRQMFGEHWKQSWIAVRTLDEWDHETEKWKRPLTEVIKQVPKYA